MKVIVIGGGPAGMMAAYTASKYADVSLYEKNNVLGKKLLLTGHGRCNVTNDTNMFFKHIYSKFLYASFSKFNNMDMIDFLNKNGISTHVEDNGRVFPDSQKSRDIVNMFIKLLKNVDIHLSTPVDRLWIEDYCKGIIVNNQKIPADRVIIATGGLSYPHTGSTGDGYIFGQQVSHTITPTKPGLTGMNAFINNGDIKDLQGLTLTCDYRIDKKKYHGDILFTHYGISGPDMINLSRKISYKHMIISIPITLSSNKKIKNLLLTQYSPKLVSFILKQTHISGDKLISELNKKEKYLLENYTIEIDIKNNRSYKEAMITIGGINTKDIYPSTMQSKLDEHVYFAGEVLDVDGDTGGYNLQIAWTTGYVAGLESTKADQ